jgi:hypothetical protein
MKRKSDVVKIAGIVAATMLAAVFVHLHGIIQANWLHYGLKLSLNSLPVPTMLYYHYSFLGYLLPIAASVAFLMGRDRRDSNLPGVDMLLWGLGIIALAWVLGCVLSWQLPVYYPVSAIR